MSIEENKAVDRRYVEEVLQKGRLDAIDELCAENYVGHVSGFPDMDRAGEKQMMTMLRAAFPDLTVKVQHQLAERDLVVHYGAFGGTHRGELMGIPPTGKRVEAAAMNINRIVDGKLVESWAILDMLGLMQQLGAASGGPGAAA
jgi:predicted ester cyclase